MNRILLFVKGCIPLFLILVIYSSQSFGQVIGDYRSFATGNWTARPTWQILNTGGTWATPTAAQGYPGQINSTANVTISSGNTVTFNSAIGPVIAGQIGGTADATTGTLVFNNNRLLTVAGSVTIGNAVTSSSGIITMTNGGTFSVNSFVVSNATGSSFTSGTGANVDTVQFNGTSTLPSSVFTTFNNITFAAGTTTDAVTALTVNGNININTGATFDIGNSTFAATGTTSISGTLGITSATGSQAFTGLVTVNTGGAWNNSINAGVTMQGGITNNGTFTAGTGVYTFNTNNQALNGNFSIPNVTVAGAITLTNNNTLTVATALSGTGTLTQAASVNAILNIGLASTITTLNAANAGNTVNYTGTGQTVNSTNFYNLTLSGSGTDVLQTGTTAIGGNLTLSGSVSTTTIIGLTITGNLSTGDGTTFTVGGFALTVKGTTTIGAGMSGSMVFSSTAGAKIFVMLIRINAGATWDNSISSPITVRGGITNNNAFISGTGVYTFNTNNQALNGTLAIARVTVNTIGLTNNNTLTVATALSGSGTLTQGTNATLNIAGTSGITTLDATTNSGNTVNYTGAAQTINPTNYYNLILSGSGAKTMNALTTSIAGNFTLSGTSSATPGGGLSIGGNSILGAGTTFTAGTFTYNLGGDWTNNGTTFNTNTSTINFNGTTALQTIGGTAATTFNNLTIDNSNGVTLNDGTNSTNKTVNAALTLSNGYLTTTSSNLLVINSGAIATVANAVAGVPQATSPYINGPMNKVGDTQPFIFPVGSLGTGCVPIGISAPGAGSTFQAQYVRASAQSVGTTITAPNLFNVSNCEYWNLNVVLGTPTVDVTAYWNANNPCNGEAPGGYVTDMSTIALAHFGGGSWNKSTPIPAMTNGGTVTGSVTWLAVSTFSPFTLGNNTVSKENPLNIKLDYFTAVKADGYNKLSWKAECTTSSNLFEAQSSSDGVHFATIDSVKVEAASDCSQAFGYNDYSSSGNKIYYRIKTTDISGNVVYSEVILLSNQASTSRLISINPNPVRSDANLNISSPQNDRVELVILSVDGKELQHKTVQVLPGVSTINLQTNSLAKGMYILKGIFSGGQTNTIKFVKQ